MNKYESNNKFGIVLYFNTSFLCTWCEYSCEAEVGALLQSKTEHTVPEYKWHPFRSPACTQIIAIRVVKLIVPFMCVRSCVVFTPGSKSSWFSGLGPTSAPSKAAPPRTCVLSPHDSHLTENNSLSEILICIGRTLALRVSCSFIKNYLIHYYLFFRRE